MKRLLTALITLAMVIALFAVPAYAEESGFVFSEWNPDAPALKALIEYVEDVTDESSPNYIPPTDRIATFDMDGTLCGELYPTYLEYWLLARRIFCDPAYQPDDRLPALAAQAGEGVTVTEDYDALLEKVDAVYIRSKPEEHASQIRRALEAGRHVLCESPLTLSSAESEALMALAAKKKLIVMEAIKTAYATAYARLLLLVKGGRIGEVLSVDAACTSIREPEEAGAEWNGIHEWGPTALLPVFQLLGTDWRECRSAVRFRDGGRDSFTKLDFTYDHAVASVKVGDGVKTEGELVISGTRGYLYVPAPWWKTDYFELRCEDPADNKRWFYQLDGEGIRYELVAFTRAIERGRLISDIGGNVTLAISSVMEDFAARRNMTLL